MTDTDKLKRLADEIAAYPDWMKDDILALIAENERLGAEKRNIQAVFNDVVGECDKLSSELDEAVALLRGLDKVRMYDEEWAPVAAFLARIDKDTE